MKKGVLVEEKLCILCGICERACNFDAIKVDKENSTWNYSKESCTFCSDCIRQCPKEALSFKDIKESNILVKIDKKQRTKNLLKNRRKKS